MNKIFSASPYFFQYAQPDHSSPTMLCESCKGAAFPRNLCDISHQLTAFPTRNFNT